MRRRTRPLALLLLLALGGCGAVDPYATIPRITQPGQPSGARVAICYNSLATTLADVKAQAQQQCDVGTTARQVDTDWYLQYCPLLLPARATFVCTAAKK